MTPVLTQQAFSRRACGFGLIELMITVLLLAIVTAIAVPSLKNLMRKQELNSQTSLMVSVLAYARSEAVSRVVPVVVCGSSDGDTCNGSADLSQGWLVFVDRDGNNLYGAGDELLRKGGGKSEISIKLAGAATHVRYSDQGEGSVTQIAMCTAEAGTHVDRARTIHVSTVGSSRVAPGATCT